jgi:hypothetical protein
MTSQGDSTRPLPTRDTSPPGSSRGDGRAGDGWAVTRRCALAVRAAGECRPGTLRAGGLAMAPAIHRRAFAAAHGSRSRSFGARRASTREPKRRGRDLETLAPAPSLATDRSAWQTPGAVSPSGERDKCFRSRLSTTRCGFGTVSVPDTAFCAPSWERRVRLPSSVRPCSRLSGVRGGRRRTLSVCLLAQFVRAVRERNYESGATRSASGVLGPPAGGGVGRAILGLMGRMVHHRV